MIEANDPFSERKFGHLSMPIYEMLCQITKCSLVSMHFCLYVCIFWIVVHYIDLLNKASEPFITVILRTHVYYCLASELNFTGKQAMHNEGPNLT